MKVAYLASLYPAPSHTFIQREILELEKLGAEVVRFSVRRSRASDQLDETARQEGTKTRSLLPFSWMLLVALAWLWLTRPGHAWRTWLLALRSSRHGGGSVVKWCAYYLEAAQLAYWLHKDGVEHLHCHFGNAGSNTAWLASLLGTAALSITFHGIDLDEPETYFHREKLSHVAFAICISEFGRRRLWANIDLRDWGKVSVVRCGFPCPELHEVPPPPRTGKIVCVARLSPEKGHHMLLEALSLLAADKVDFDCTLVGGGPLENKLAQDIVRRGLGNDVRLAGAMANEEVVKLIAASDLTVLASYGEGVPVALLESLAWRRPFVATQVGGIPELAPVGASGILVAPGDAVGLKEGLKHLIEDPDFADGLAEAGRKLVLELHDPAQSALSLLDMFEASNERPRWSAHRFDRTGGVAEKA